MATERLLLTGYHQESRTVTVEYVERPHWMGDGKNRNGGRWIAYDVKVDGEPVGMIEQSTASTDRVYGRIRVPGRGRLAWSHRHIDGSTNRPGYYAATRRTAVARLLGFSHAAKVAL